MRICSAGGKGRPAVLASWGGPPKMRHPLDADALPKHAPDEFHLLIQLIPSRFNAPPDLFGMVAAILELVDSEGDDQSEEHQSQKSAHIERLNALCQREAWTLLAEYISST